MKKLVMLILSMLMVFSIFSVAYATDLMNTPMLISAMDNSIKVQQDGTYIDFTDANGNVVEPQIINNRTMVPFRKIFNSLGVTDDDITFIGETRTVIAKKGDMTIELQIDNNIAKKTVSGETTNITLDSAPVIVDNRTLVPVRFIAESMEKKVGWDQENRTVIIIDTNKLEEKLRNSIPKYFEIAELQTEKLDTFDITAGLNGEIDYTSKKTKENNSNVKLTGDIDMKKSEDAIYVGLDLAFSGKGVVYDEIKNSGIAKLDFELLLKGNKMYMKSSITDEQTGGKWIVTEDEEVKDLIEQFDTLMVESKATDLLAFDENKMNISTYDQLLLTSELMKIFFSDDKIKISGKSTVKYEMEIDFFDLVEFLSNFGFDASTVDIIKEAKIDIAGTVKNGVANTSSVKLEFEIEQDGENIDLDLSVDSKINAYNKTIKIDEPSANETYPVENM